MSHTTFSRLEYWVTFPDSPTHQILVWLRARGLLGLTHWLAGYHTPVPQLEVTPTST